MLHEIGIDSVEAFDDSMMVVQQIRGEFNCFDETLQRYRDRCLEIIDAFNSFSVQHIHREDNSRANELAQHASGYRVYSHRGLSEVVEKTYPRAEILLDDVNDWRMAIVGYLRDPSQLTDRKIRRQALKYVLIDETLYRRTIEGLLLRCLGPEESKVATGEVHDGLCGTHQSAHKMKWMLRKLGYFWPTMLEDCFEYYKGCQGCQRFGVACSNAYTGDEGHPLFWFG